MQNTNSLKEFILHNDKELRYLVASICSRHDAVHLVDDIIQDVYFRLCSGRIIEAYYDPSKSLISSYLYPLISNIVRSYKKTDEVRIEKHRYSADYDNLDDFSDEIEFALRYNDAVMEYQNVVDSNNISDGIDGLAFELRDFEENFLASKLRNKKYTLSKRKHQDVETDGCTLLDIFRYMKAGLSNREISKIYGVSDMFVTNLKREIRQALKKYGIDWSMPEE